MHIAPETLLDALRSENLRITAPRRIICDVIASAHDDHLTAAGIVDHAMRAFATSLDASTVYRTLDALEHAGILTHAHLGHGASVYHLADEAAHHHLICSSCGATQAISETELEGFVTQLRQRTGFVADPTHFAMSGLCAACAASE